MNTNRISRVIAALPAVMTSILTLTACGSSDPASESSTDEAVVRPAPAPCVRIVAASTRRDLGGA